MKIEDVIRSVLSTGLWIAIFAILLTLGNLLGSIGIMMPIWSIWIASAIGLILTALIWNKHSWGFIKRKVAMQQQSDGASAPTREKRKREQIDGVLKDLSDSELLNLKERLQAGQLDDEQLVDWLEEQQTTADTP